MLQGQLDECRWLYNHFLEERKQAWEERQESLSLYDLYAELPSLKGARPAMKAVHSQVLQNVAVRIDLAMQAFFRRVSDLPLCVLRLDDRSGSQCCIEHFGIGTTMPGFGLEAPAFTSGESSHAL